MVQKYKIYKLKLLLLYEFLKVYQDFEKIRNVCKSPRMNYGFELQFYFDVCIYFL